MMDEKYDTGPIFEQIAFLKTDDCSPQKLVIQNIKYMKILLVDFFNNYPKIKCIPQDDPQVKQKTLIHL
ncbi:hypothetical protein [Clostridium pasteurianum]|uniref:hypothetical protein n=1 Tax=Clostridium pasteurianum TaxID=1501 RepID=UPI0008264C14|nr:hypothetical protein [Clostridium pasteurianum]